MKKLLLPFVLFITLLTSCWYSKEMQELKIDNRFAIKVAGYMSPSSKLHPNPDIQYENRYRTVYLLVLDTVKLPGTTLDSYTQNEIKLLTSTSKQKAMVTPIDSVTTVSSMPAKRNQMVINLTGEDVYFDMLTVEAKDRYYQVLGWTLQRRKDKYGPDIDSMVTSFRLL